LSPWGWIYPKVCDACVATGQFGAKIYDRDEYKLKV